MKRVITLVYVDWSVVKCGTDFSAIHLQDFSNLIQDVPVSTELLRHTIFGPCICDL